ncbi:MAG: cytochrome b [Pseudomonadota bacterium]
MRTALVRTDRYSWVAIGLHWLIALLVVVNLVTGLFHDTLFDGVAGLIPVHKSIGIGILALTVVRIGWRLAHRPPALSPDVAGWERVAARVIHAAFYALLLIVPLSGWAMVSAGDERRPLFWFGLFRLPWLPVSDAVGEAADQGHLIAGYLMAALVVAHVAAALRHHFLLKDSVLARMLPVAMRRR